MAAETFFAVVWHSRTGAARAMAQAVAEGGGGHAKLYSAETVSPADLLAADGYVFVCPENLASMSGIMKEMFDRSYYPLLAQHYPGADLALLREKGQYVIVKEEQQQDSPFQFSNIKR